MQFRTEVDLSNPTFDISYSSKVLFIGSCFSENIGDKLKTNKFDTVVNPFGTIFNVASISKLLSRSLQKNYFSIDEIEYNNHTELYFHYDLHSSFSHSFLNTVIELANKAIEKTHNTLANADIVIITLGTSYVYVEKNNGIVANCHKIPQFNFTKELLSISEQSKTIKSIISEIRILNPNTKFILTVSPVRHIKEGLSNNSLSKSILKIVCDDVCTSTANTYYFPAFEIMVDDLRDYRYYTNDFIHPNDQAITYIWNKFSDAFFTPITMSTLKVIAAINNDLNHRYSNPFSLQAKKHKESIERKIETLDEIIRQRFNSDKPKS